MKYPFRMLTSSDLSDEGYVAMQEEGKIKIAPFQNEKGKYFSTVADEDSAQTLKIRESSRVKILATYIFTSDKIVGLKFQRYEKRDGKIQPNPTTINLSFDQSCTLLEFADFLSKADLKSVARGKVELATDLSLDKDLAAKLVSISKDEQGKKVLEAFIENSYLTSGDIATSAIKLLRNIKDDHVLEESIRALAEESNLDIADLIKVGLSPTKLREKSQQLAEFETLIARPDVKEVSDIQSELQKMPWIFGPEYESLDIRDAGDEGVPDRRLKRIDGLSDILEIKLPKAEVLRADKQGRHFMAPPLTEALGQLTGYLEHFYSEYSKEKDDETGSEVLEDLYGKYYKPKGILLIGRRHIADGTKKISNTVDAEPKYLRRLTSYFHWIEVLTYDDLIERAKNGLKKIVA